MGGSYQSGWFADVLAKEHNQLPNQAVTIIEEDTCNPLEARLSYATVGALP